MSLLCRFCMLLTESKRIICQPSMRKYYWQKTVWVRNFSTILMTCNLMLTVWGVHKSLLQAWELEDSSEISHRREAIFLPVFWLYESVQQQLGQGEAPTHTRGHGEYISSIQPLHVKLSLCLSITPSSRRGPQAPERRQQKSKLFSRWR